MKNVILRRLIRKQDLGRTKTIINCLKMGVKSLENLLILISKSQEK